MTGDETTTLKPEREPFRRPMPVRRVLAWGLILGAVLEFVQLAGPGG
jgi:hypothetical protein